MAVNMNKFSVVDWGDLNKDRQKFTQNVLAMFKDNGFIVLRNSPISQFRPNVQEAREQFFKNNLETLKSLSIEDNDNEGFHIPKKTDTKWYFHLGRHVREALKNSEDRTLENLSSYSENQAKKLNTEFRYFKNIVTKNYDHGVEVCTQLLTIFEEGLGIRKGAFTDKIQKGNHIGRYLYYPPEIIQELDDFGHISYKKTISDKKYRAKAHGDSGLLTAIPLSEVRGLQLAVCQPTAVSFGPKSDLEKIPAEQYLEIPYSPDDIVIHAGHTLTALSNGFFPSTIHRVVKISDLSNGDDDLLKKPRYAEPFFLHANPDILMTALPETVALRDGDNLFENGKNITIKEYVQAPDEFDSMRQICVKGEHPHVFLKKYFAQKAIIH